MCKTSLLPFVLVAVAAGEPAVPVTPAQPPAAAAPKQVETSAPATNAAGQGQGSAPFAAARPLVVPPLEVSVPKVSPSYAVVIAEADRKLADPAVQADPALQATAALHKARAIEAWISVDQAQAIRYPEAIRAYRTAAQVGTPEQRALAQNNLGVLLLRSGNAREAVAELEMVDDSTAPPAKRAAYAFNWGRALEAVSEPDRALVRYQAALALDPGLRPAAEGAYRLLGARAAWAAMAALASSFVERGQPETAARLIHDSLLGSPPADAVALLVPLVQVYALAPLPPARFQAEEWPLLSPLRARPAAWPAAVNEIRAAFTKSLEVLDRPSQARKTFGHWSGARSRAVAMSQLLKRLGDLRAHEGDPQQALARYQHAWGLDPENTEAIVYMASLLHDRGEALDPGGRVLRRLVQNLFMEKGEAYARTDLPNILRLHTVLGTIFEQQQRWGPSSQQDTAPPDTALFQWSRAVRTAEMLRARDRGYPPTPGLEMHLAGTLVAVHDEERAGQSLLRAAEGFLTLKDREGARDALRRLDEVPSSARGSERARALREQVGAL